MSFLRKEVCQFVLNLLIKQDMSLEIVIYCLNLANILHLCLGVCNHNG
jgi:hypothetical protein